MYIGLISESRGQLYNKEYKKKFMQAAYSTFYSVKKKKIQKHYEFLKSNPDLQIAINMWNMLDSP